MPATHDDKSFILSLIPRLTAFDPPLWRHIYAMTEYDAQIIDGSGIFAKPDKV
jgi:hypothetical protein